MPRGASSLASSLFREILRKILPFQGLFQKLQKPFGRASGHSRGYGSWKMASISAFPSLHSVTVEITASLSRSMMESWEYLPITPCAMLCTWYHKNKSLPIGICP